MSDTECHGRIAEEDSYPVLIPRVARGGRLEEKNFKSAMQGYDYEFVNGLEAKFECPICLLCQRDPMQTSCGHRFCQSCIVTWIRKGRNNCPADNEIITEDDLFLDKFAKREISAILVRCPNKPNGCTGELEIGKVEEHVKLCPYTLIQCPNDCTVSVLSRDLESHLTNECLRRTITCKLCFMDFPLSDQQNHFLICPMVTVPCDCGDLIKREEMEFHKSSTCPIALVNCEYFDLGCTEKMKREELSLHLKTNMEKHLRIVFSAFKQFRTSVQEGGPSNDKNADSISCWLNQAGDISPEIEEHYMEKQSFVPPPLSIATGPEHLRNIYEKNVHLEQKTRELELKLEGCKRQLKKSDKTIANLTSALANVEARFCNGVQFWKIENFSRLRHEAVLGHNRVLHSPGFYTSSYGYKVCLRLNVQQSENSAYVSLFIHLMQGEYDDWLSWPFSGKITMSILDLFDRNDTKNDITETMHTKPGLTAFRKPTTERNPKGFGYTEFVTVDTLITGPYIKDDSIVVRAVVTI